jgi:predicted enzyme related to lactoylglutathione lyase
MSDTKGQFVWYELMTTDPKGAKAFYEAVVGWAAQDMPMPGMTYTMLNAGETGVAGLYEMMKEARDMGAQPGWLGYVAVADVDQATVELKKLGGTVHKEPTDIPNVGRFSVCADPGGATIALFKGTGNMAAPKEDLTTLGHVGWHELYAADLGKAWPFYEKLFGWKKTETMPMGDMGDYQLFGRGGESIGGMMGKPAFVPAPFWNYYFNVADIDLAAARVTKNGGQLRMGPMEVPGGGWVLQGGDPQGAHFALFGKKTA